MVGLVGLVEAEERNIVAHCRIVKLFQMKSLRAVGPAKICFAAHRAVGEDEAMHLVQFHGSVMLAQECVETLAASTPIIDRHVCFMEAVSGKDMSHFCKVEEGHSGFQWV